MPAAILRAAAQVVQCDAHVVKWCAKCQRETRWGVRIYKVGSTLRTCLACDATARRTREARGPKPSAEEQHRIMQENALAKIISGPLGHPRRKVTSKSIIELDEALTQTFNGAEGLARLTFEQCKTAIEKEQVYNVVKILGMIFQVKKEADGLRTEADKQLDAADIQVAIMESIKAEMTPELFVHIGLACLSDEDRTACAERLLAIEVVPAEMKNW